MTLLRSPRRGLDQPLASLPHQYEFVQINEIISLFLSFFYARAFS